MTNIPNCPRCSGWWECCGCGEPLRRKHTPSTVEPNVWGSSDVRRYLEAIRDQELYTLRFPLGSRGGAVLALGCNDLEVFLPWQDEQTGDVLPYMPMPLHRGMVIHDPTRGRTPKPWEIAACRAGDCQCDETATGWKLTRPLIREVLGVGDGFLAEHGRDLPGVLPCWCLCVSTPVFMRDAVFDGSFRTPTRAAARAARAVREAARKCRPPRPRDRRPRPRRK